MRLWVHSRLEKEAASAIIIGIVAVLQDSFLHGCALMCMSEKLSHNLVELLKQNKSERNPGM